MDLEKTVNDLKGKVGEVLDKTDIDEKIKENPGIIKEKVDEVLSKTDLDEKIMGKLGGLGGK